VALSFILSLRAVYLSFLLNIVYIANNVNKIMQIITIIFLGNKKGHNVAEAILIRGDAHPANIKTSTSDKLPRF
jgi:hypothetical protein